MYKIKERAHIISSSSLIFINIVSRTEEILIGEIHLLSPGKSIRQNQNRANVKKKKNDWSPLDN